MTAFGIAFLVLCMVLDACVPAHAIRLHGAFMSVMPSRSFFDFGRNLFSPKSRGDPFGNEFQKDDDVLWDSSLWEGLEKALTFDYFQAHEVLPLQYYEQIQAGNAKAMVVHPLKLDEIRAEIEKIVRDDLIIGGSLGDYALLESRPDGLDSLGLFFLQEYRFTIALMHDTEGNYPTKFAVRGNAAQQLTDELGPQVSQKLMKRLHIIAEEHLRTMEKMKPGAWTALLDAHMQYGVRWRTALLNPTLINQQRFNGMIVPNVLVRTNIVQLLPVLPANFANMDLGKASFFASASGRGFGFNKGATQKKAGIALPPLPWKGLGLAGSIPLKQTPVERADTLSFQLKSYWKTTLNNYSYRQRKRFGTPRSTARAAVDPLLERYGDEAATQKDAKRFENVTMKFDKCSMVPLYRYHKTYTTLSHCVMLPISVERLLPDELATMHLSHVYPLKTKVVYVRREASEVHGGTKELFLYRTCEEAGWGFPLFLKKENFVDLLSTCRESRMSINNWGIEGIQASVISSRSIPKAPPPPPMGSMRKKVDFDEMFKDG